MNYGETEKAVCPWLIWHCQDLLGTYCGLGAAEALCVHELPIDREVVPISC